MTTASSISNYNQIDQLNTVRPASWLYANADPSKKSAASNAMWRHVMKERDIKMKEQFRLDSERWRRDHHQGNLASKSSSTTSSDPPASIWKEQSFDAIKLRRENLVLKHLPCGEMTGCNRRLFIVGICGRSGSGKSTLAKRLCKTLRMPFPPLQTDWFRKVSGDTAVHQPNTYWEGPASQDLTAFYDAVIEVAYLLQTGKDDDMHSFDIITPAFGCHTLRANKEWENLQHRHDESVGLCLEGFVLFAEPMLVSLCHDLIFLDVDAETACQRRLQRQYGTTCQQSVADSFRLRYMHDTAAEHDAWIKLQERNVAHRIVIRPIGISSPQELLEHVLCSLRLSASFLPWESSLCHRQWLFAGS